MDTNPFGILTFIVAPAILTNASSVNALATSNRLGRATDRARQISAILENHKDDSDPWRTTYLVILGFAERRIKLLVKAMTCFYAAIGSFASASLVSLFGAIFFVEQWQLCGMTAMGISVLCGVIGVGGLAYWIGALGVGNSRDAAEREHGDSLSIATSHANAGDR